jgi:uncharacterized protein
VNIAAYEKLLPAITNSNRPYWEGCVAGELRLQSCDDCGEKRFPESSCCPHCLSERFTWKAVSGKGILWSWILMHQKYYAAFEDELPYLVAFVQLAEGPFMMSTLVGDMANLRCDAPVEVVFEKAGNERIIPKFKVVKP